MPDSIRTGAIAAIMTFTPRAAAAAASALIYQAGRPNSTRASKKRCRRSFWLPVARSAGLTPWSPMARADRLASGCRILTSVAFMHLQIKRKQRRGWASCAQMVPLISPRSELLSVSPMCWKCGMFTNDSYLVRVRSLADVTESFTWELCRGDRLLVIQRSTKTFPTRVEALFDSVQNATSLALGTNQDQPD